MEELAQLGKVVELSNYGQQKFDASHQCRNGSVLWQSISNKVLLHASFECLAELQLPFSPVAYSSNFKGNNSQNLRVRYGSGSVVNNESYFLQHLGEGGEFDRGVCLQESARDGRVLHERVERGGQADEGANFGTHSTCQNFYNLFHGIFWSTGLKSSKSAPGVWGSHNHGSPLEVLRKDLQKKSN